MHSENLKISVLRKKFQLRLRSRRRKPFPKQFSVKSIKTNNKFAYLSALNPKHPLRLLVAKGSLPSNYYNNFRGNLVLSSVRNKRTAYSNRSASLDSIKKHRSGKYVQPRHKIVATKGSHSFFSSSMQTTSSLLPVNFSNRVNLFFVSRLTQSVRYSELFEKEVNYHVNLLSNLFEKLSVAKLLPSPASVPVNVPSRAGFSSTFFFIPEVNFMKFFSKGSNLIRSSRGLLIPKIARKAVTTGNKLSIDSYSLNYFSYKSPISSKAGDSELVKYTSCLHLKSGLLSVVRIPKPFHASSSTNNLLLKNAVNFLSTKRPRARLRRCKRRINKALRRMIRFGRGHFFKRTNMLNRFFRNKSNFVIRMRHTLNTLQGLDVYRSRFANISSPVVRSYDRFNLPIVTVTSASIRTPKFAHSMFSKQLSLPVNEFSHQLLAHYLSSPSLLKVKLLGRSQNARHFVKSLGLSKFDYTNIYPVADFRKRVLKRVKKFVTGTMLRINLTPWYHNTIIRFFENCSGNKVMLQYYLSVANRVDSESIVLYKRWMPRMASYERKLGHRFFLEEALHIIHLSFRLHDSSLVANWLKAMIKRISFWKTRSIFRFLKYLFNNYLESSFNYLGVRGFKVRLKGKISAAGNSRKRNIVFRSGKTSYASVNLKCLHTKSTISTFTGVMGFQVWLFY